MDINGISLFINTIILVLLTPINFITINQRMCIFRKQLWDLESIIFKNINILNRAYSTVLWKSMGSLSTCFLITVYIVISCLRTPDLHRFTQVKLQTPSIYLSRENFACHWQPRDWTVILVLSISPEITLYLYLSLSYSFLAVLSNSGRNAAWYMVWCFITLVPF